jgi:hypothetical protein
MKNENKATSEFVSLLITRHQKSNLKLVGLDWNALTNKLNENPIKLQSLMLMEETGGEPSIVGYDYNSNIFTFFDCSKESPSGRRSLCYDDQALEERKENKPKGSAIGIALSMGVVILNEEEYRYLQTLGDFDLKTSTWIETPKEIRKLGGALFCDKRYNAVFTYHNGAQSYYAARGFRAKLIV